MEHRTLLHGSRQRIVHAHDTIRSSIVHPRRNLQRVSVQILVAVLASAE